MLSSFSYFKDEKTKDDNFSSSKHDIMYVIHRMREICRRKTREISKGVQTIFAMVDTLTNARKLAKNIDLLVKVGRFSLSAENSFRQIFFFANTKKFNRVHPADAVAPPPTIVETCSFIHGGPLPSIGDKFLKRASAFCASFECLPNN